MVLTQIGRVHLAAGKAPLAVAPLERAVAIFKKASARPAEAADARFALARALWTTRAAGRDEGERPRAIGLAGEAREGYAADGPGSAAARAAVEAWLSKHPR